MGESKFVFFSRKRWKKVKITTVLLVIIFAGFLFIGFKGFTENSFSRMFPENKLKAVVDSISTRSPGNITIEGNGPILKLEESSNGYNLVRSNPEKNERMVYLTFDDGPHPSYTRQILDILDRENIKASFFVVGQNAYKHPELIKEIVEAGHLIGAHTFTHSGDEIKYYNDSTRMYYEFELTQRVIEQNSNVTTNAFRLPFWGTEPTISLNNLVLAANASNRGYTIFGSTVDSNDWQAPNTQYIINHLSLQSDANPVVLLHDGGGNRQVTVDSLDEVIDFYRTQGYNFATVADLVPNQPMNQSLNHKEEFFTVAAFTIYDVYKKTPSLLTTIFLVGLGIYIVHTIFVVFFAILQRLTESKIQKRRLLKKPLVSVVVPVFNEEKVIFKTLRSIIRSSYKNFELLIVNDGSRDGSIRVIRRFIKKNPNINITLLMQKNQGKAEALNYGFRQATGEIVVAIDADTLITQKTIENFVRHFSDLKVGAVAGYIKVGNQVNFITELQELDYRMALNLERRAFSYLNSVFVVPGAIGAWRRSAILAAGGFSDVTLTEDGEIGMRLKKLGYKIGFESKAIGITEAPENLTGLIRQRFRWTFGGLQTMWLHKDMLFRPKYGFFGLVVFPYTFLVQVPNLILVPFFEFLAIPLAIFVSVKLVLIMMLLMLISRALLFIVASLIAGESLRLIFYTVPYRFFYQFLWYFVFNLALLVAVKGSFVAWKKMDRTGSVRVNDISKPAINYSEIPKI